MVWQEHPIRFSTGGRSRLRGLGVPLVLVQAESLSHSGSMSHGDPCHEGLLIPHDRKENRGPVRCGDLPRPRTQSWTSPSPGRVGLGTVDPFRDCLAGWESAWGDHRGLPGGGVCVGVEC